MATNNNNSDIALLFASATSLSRKGISAMANGFKVYHDKIAIKHPSLKGGEKALVKVAGNRIIFTLDEKGNRTLSSKGGDGRVMIALNEQMRKVFAATFTAHKHGNSCDTLELETAQDANGNNYYILNANAKAVG